MAIKLSKNNLCVNQIVGQKTEKIVVEGDEIVPDIKPDILSVVSTNGNICIYSDFNMCFRYDIDDDGQY